MMQEIRRDAYVKNFGIFISFQHATREFLKNTDRQNEKKSIKLIKVRPFCIVLFLLEQTATVEAYTRNCLFQVINYFVTFV